MVPMVQRICEMPDDHFGVPIPLAPCSRTLAVLSPGVSHTTVEEEGKRGDGAVWLWGCVVEAQLGWRWRMELERALSSMRPCRGEGGVISAAPLYDQ